MLIERAVDDFDSGCELGDGIDGLTDFYPGKKPRVKVAARLQESYLENRLRTTLTHEYGHVLLHGFLFELQEELKRLFEGEPRDTRNQCHRDTINDGSTDWMEWQAGFASGALLMPATELNRVVKQFREIEGIEYADIGVESEIGGRLIGNVMELFQVSREAARVRMEQRRVITKKPVQGLFG